jgi:hypothetical protein
MQTHLIYPMFAMVILTMVVMAITVTTRVRAVRNKEMDGRYFKTFSVGTPTEAVIKTGRHLSNLFEVPVLFYVGCLAAMILIPNNPAMQVYAWLFVFARVVQAWIHLGKNRIYPRMLSFAFGVTMIFTMWIHLLIAAQP